MKSYINLQGINIMKKVFFILTLIIGMTTANAQILTDYEHDKVSSLVFCTCNGSPDAVKARLDADFLKWSPDSTTAYDHIMFYDVAVSFRPDHRVSVFVCGDYCGLDESDLKSDPVLWSDIIQWRKDDCQDFLLRIIKHWGLSVD